ncbi:stage II sporulation protein R [Brevibacillus fulvus]|uniref:Stage II sporulation protein R n=1 Tax=Brevibacillus fulvus TaxID=1125967 RepID=A0A938XTI8_9BACL|nr:stage II sporulation protein R [Brevibacillus fulvus]MBM7590198.1 stage II sporulation protein R [Brevibacillus fulvus]
MKRFFFLLAAFLVAWMSWENQLNAANVIDNGPIPEKSIRLRIIANSDSVRDQWVKREVRDAIVARMNQWVSDLHSYDQAEVYVRGKLPELQQLVDETIAERGFAYKAVVDFGQVPFPTKLYGSYVYPAGNYEALRVRIGEAKGQNWWCVLFPPLCFIDMANGDAIEPSAEKPTDKSELLDDRTIVGDNDQETVDTVDKPMDFVDKKEETVAVASAGPEISVRSYFWDMVTSWF